MTTSRTLSTILLTVALGAAQGAVPTLQAQGPTATSPSLAAAPAPRHERIEALAAHREAIADDNTDEGNGAGRFLGTVLATSAGSIAGGFGGLMLGYAADPELQGYSIVVGAVAGSLIGATAGSALVTKNAGRSILGASAGLLAGGLLVHAIGSDIGGPGVAVSFALVQGLVTAAIASR